MKDPKKVFTENGYLDWLLALRQLELSLFTVINSADDLHIGAQDDAQLETLYNMQRLLESGVLKTGDGEKDD